MPLSVIRIQYEIYDAELARHLHEVHVLRTLVVITLAVLMGLVLAFLMMKR